MRRQLQQVPADLTFLRASRPSALLCYIVEETLAGRGDQLKEYTVGVAVLGRGTGFDPRLASLVRVEASKLRARLATYYKEAGSKDAIRIELPRGSYAPRIVPANGGVDGRPPRGAAELRQALFRNLLHETQVARKILNRV